MKDKTSFTDVPDFPFNNVGIFYSFMLPSHWLATKWVPLDKSICRLQAVNLFYTF
jgi:hypothetical protein